MTAPAEPRYAPAALGAFVQKLFEAAGLATARAKDVAEVLLEGDLLGHTTHGLALAPLYLRSLREGGMAVAGEPTSVSDHGSALTWDGNYLPGPWLVRHAIAEATRRLENHPVVTVVMRRSHHIGCLQAYLPPVVTRGHVVLLSCSDPAHRSVAPFGAIEGAYSPNPIAAGFPTASGPVLIDISTSATAYGQVVRAARAGVSLPGPWLVGPDGKPTVDPSGALDERGVVLQPLGGSELGHKGFALGLLVEALTSGLAGHGRADAEARWGASVFLQLIDPSRFAGAESFGRETGFLADACRSARVAPGNAPVRLPGDGALARRTEHLERGVALPPGVMSALMECAQLSAVAVPAPLT